MEGADVQPLNDAPWRYEPTKWLKEQQKKLDAIKANVVDDFNRIARINSAINRYLMLRSKKAIKGGFGIQ